MGKREKREWKVTDASGSFFTSTPTEFALWAIVERLEALVAIGDALEEVGDLWANTLAFGGQPVGEVGQPVSERGLEGMTIGQVKAWRCDKGRGDCSLMMNHGGDCVPPRMRGEDA